MFRGSLVALVTPMGSDGAIDYKSLESLIEYHINKQTDGIVVVGTTGESATLDEAEHCRMIRRAVEIVKGRIAVIAGTGANSTHEAIALTACAKKAGVDACLLVSPYYNKPTQDGLYLHHKAIAQAVDIPQILYNVPGRTAVDMLPETIERLATISNIIGVKEATGDVSRIKEIRQRTGNDFMIYSGDDATGMRAMLAGANGVISVTSNVAPARMHALCEFAMAGEVSSADKINRQLNPMHESLFVESNPIPVKWVLAEMGLIPDGIRLPMTPLSEKFHQTLREAMSASEIIKIT